MTGSRHTPFNVVITAMGGTPAAARLLHLSPVTIRSWRRRGISLDGATALLSWAQRKGCDEAVDFLVSEIARKTRRREALSYLQRCVAYAAGGWFPTFGVTGKAVMPREPAVPPQHMTQDEIAAANGWLARRGWQLMRGATGELRPVRQL